MTGDAIRIARPRLPRPGPDDHKYTRGLVVIVAGAMPGAAALAALGAAQAGAGYVRILTRDRIPGLPHAIVQDVGDAASAATSLSDPRIDAVVVGPGMPDRTLVAAALESGRPLVVDAGAILDADSFAVAAILTPHEGEFARRFPDLSGTRIDRARTAARETGAVVLLKGAESIVASPDGRATICDDLPHGLATAGTGDVLAGLCGTMLAQLGDPFAAACAALYVQRAAALAFAGTPFIADDLPPRIPAIIAECA